MSKTKPQFPCNVWEADVELRVGDEPERFRLVADIRDGVIKTLFEMRRKDLLGGDSWTREIQSNDWAKVDSAWRSYAVETMLRLKGMME